MKLRPSRLLIWLSTCALLSASLAACGTGDNGQSDGELVVVTSTSIVAALAEQVGGDQLSVTSLMGPGVDPHTFEMTPGDVKTLADADLVLINGIGLDNYLIDDVESASGSSGIVVVIEGIELLEAGDHGEFDPHVWQDPVRVKAMVQNIAAALEEADPDHAADYQRNAADYQQTLDETDERIRALIDEIPVENRKLVTNHDALAYFADRYGLEIVGTVIPGSSSEADPSANDIAHLTELIRKEGVKAIFAEALIDPKVAEALASDTGVEIVYGLYTGQVGEPGSGAETVDGLLLANATKISEALR